jgi:hypothetical protein
VGFWIAFWAMCFVYSRISFLSLCVSVFGIPIGFAVAYGIFSFFFSFSFFVLDFENIVDATT